MSKAHYYWGLAFITLGAAALRFWHLGELQQFVFDEVYFPKYAYGHLTGTYYFDTHPPLSKYIIACGIWLHQQLPWVDAPPIGSIPLNEINAWAWRWVNATTGTLLVIIAARTAYMLRASYLLSLLVALFIAIDGTLLVESRFGLNNIYLVSFGMLAIYFLARAFRFPHHGKRNIFLCGIFLAFCYSIKWNGLGYSAVAWALLLAPSLLYNLCQHNKAWKKWLNLRPISLLFTKIKLWQQGLFLILIPLVIYSILWIPYLTQFERFGFVEMQRQIMTYHSKTITADEHPYCSKWHEWPLMKRPISYHFFADKEKSPAVYTDIHLFGNPILFWLSCLAVFVLLGFWLRNGYNYIKRRTVSADFLYQSVVLVGFFSNWLPWSQVSRCLFLYHYIPSATFSFMALAWVLHKGFERKNKWVVALTSVLLLSILVAFVYWLPFQLGIETSQQGFYSRMWFNSWI